MPTAWDQSETPGPSGHHYDIIRVLGRGSYGTVLLARVAPEPRLGQGIDVGHEEGDLRVIKKVELPDVEEKQRGEVLHEIEVLRSLSHPNIIGYHEAFVEGTTLCISLEYADGGDLAAAILRRREAGQRFQERDAMALFAQLTLAVQCMHERRIMHRDLKSENVFLMASGVVKLGDFGISKVLRASVRCAETRVGSPYYLPPELCDNQPYDFKADVWCLGVVFYEVLALEVPFCAQNIAALVIKIVTADPKPLPAMYGSETRSIVARMLVKNAEDRPSIAEVAALPHVRRSIAALATGGVGQESPGDHRLPEVVQDVGEAATGRLPAAPLNAWRPVDLAEVEDLICESPAKRVRATSSRTGIDVAPTLTPTPAPPSCHPPVRAGWSEDPASASLDLLELEVLLGAAGTTPGNHFVEEGLGTEMACLSLTTGANGSCLPLPGARRPVAAVPGAVARPLLRRPQAPRSLEGDFGLA